MYKKKIAKIKEMKGKWSTRVNRYYRKHSRFTEIEMRKLMQWYRNKDLGWSMRHIPVKLLGLKGKESLEQTGEKIKSRL